jgi:CHAT domain-containing protein
LKAALAGRALLELIQLGDVLWSVSVTERSLRLHRLGPVSEVLAEVANLRFALRRMVTRRGSSPASMAASVASALHASARLDDLLIGPSRADIGDRPLVIVPTGELHALPWAALPHCQARPFTVAPSGAVWLAAEQPSGPPSSAGRANPVVLVAGPGLPGAGEEVTDLALLYGDRHPMTGSGAAVALVMKALDGTALAHIAAHGTYRADSPLFSSLRLADGPLTVYDLEGLSRPPDLLVLSACDSGVSAVRPGDELMGLSSALLGLGTRSVVAGALVVPDSATRPLMLEFHRRLRGGDRPAVALAAARAATNGSATDAPEAFAAAASFLCFGAG